MSYPNYGYGVGYGTNPYYQGYQQPYQPNQFMNTNRQEQSQPMQNIEQPIRNVPFTQVLYGTLEQAKGQIMFPGKSMLFINPNKNEAYLTSADADGKPTFKVYEYVSQDDGVKDTQKEPEKADYFVKKEELKDFVTKKDLGEVLTQKDLTAINEKLAMIEKKLEIKKLALEVESNGK